MKKIIYFILFVMGLNSLYADDEKLKDYYSMVPPAPNAAALGKFGDIPAGGVTGIPSIGVPIYTYTGPDKGLSLSVSLDYFAGGVRVDEMASNVGIGWALNAGGVISRNMRGTWDEQTAYGFCNWNKLPKSEFEGNNLDSNPLFKQISAYAGDSQFDIFNFNFNGRSGRFILGKDNKILILSQDKLRIEKVHDTRQNGKITQFTITDEKGYQYLFADLEIMYNSYMNVYPAYVSSWYLSRIISPSGKNVINFTYSKTSYQYQVGRSQTDTYALIPFEPTIPPSTSVLTNSVAEGKRLEKITFPNGTILECKYAATARTDLPGDYLLKEFVISGGGYKHGFILEQDYSLNRATLNKVIPYAMKNEVQVREGAYRFEYYDRLPNRLSMMQDHWGFPNDNPASSLIPKIKFMWEGQFRQFGTADRSTHPLRCLDGSLRRMDYPTGGYTEFEMEANRAKDDRLGTEAYAGGLRLKKMTDYTASKEVAMVKEYDYTSENGTTTGRLGTFPVYHNLVHYHFYDWGTTIVPPPPVTYMSGPPYHVVISSSTVTPLCNVSGSPVTYERITERVKSGDTSTGKTERYYRTFNETHVASDFPYIPPFFLPWFYGQVDSAKYYDANNVLLKKEENRYEYFYNEWLQDPNNEEAFRSMVIVPVTFYKYFGMWIWDDPKYYKFNHFYPHEGRVELTSKKTTTYTSESAVETSVSYTYSPFNRQVKTETTTTSTGETIVKRYNYPQDMVSAGKDPQGIYDRMIKTKNMVANIIETITQRGSQPVELVRNNYSNPFTNVYTPENMEIQVGSNPIETRAEFIYNDAGRPLSFSKKGDAATVLLWGYNSQHPIAEIKGATYDEVKGAISGGEVTILSLASSHSPDMSKVNALRTYSWNKPVMVTTYTYSPLVGVTSVTDPSGVTTTYDYDSFGRLQTVKDYNGNILNHYRYHYKNN